MPKPVMSSLRQLCRGGESPPRRPCFNYAAPGCYLCLALSGMIPSWLSRQLQECQPQEVLVSIEYLAWLGEPVIPWRQYAPV